MKKLTLSTLVIAGLVLSTSTSNAYTIYGTTTVNGTSYNLSPGADLSNADLNNANLYLADLSNANLTNANLSNANLSDADLYFANLTNANLSNANLSDASLYFANLSNANLSSADLTYASLYGATVSYNNWNDFYTNSGAIGLTSNYAYANTLTYAGHIPEPSTYGLMLGGLALAAVAIRRRKKTA